MNIRNEKRQNTHSWTKQKNNEIESLVKKTKHKKVAPSKVFNYP